jgi:hypothetical protein
VPIVREFDKSKDKEKDSENFGIIFQSEVVWQSYFSAAARDTSRLSSSSRTVAVTQGPKESHLKLFGSQKYCKFPPKIFGAIDDDNSFSPLILIICHDSKKNFPKMAGRNSE